MLFIKTNRGKGLSLCSIIFIGRGYMQYKRLSDKHI